MNPNDPNTVPPTPEPIPPVVPVATPDNPVDYLDEIAGPPEKARFLSGKMLIVLIGAVIVLVIVIIIGIITNSARQSSGSEVTALNNKLSDLQSIIEYGQKNTLSNFNTVKVVAETNLIAMSRQSELTKVYTFSSGSETDAGPSVTTDLDSAKALGNLDNIYITVLRDQLLSVCKQLELLYDSAKTDAEKNALAKAYADFKELANRLPDSAS